MRKAFFVSALLLLTTCGLAWSVPTLSADPADVAEIADTATTPAASQLDLSRLGLPQPTWMTSCTVSCDPDPWDPTAPRPSCTSASGNCSHGYPKGAEIITCDGHLTMCPFNGI